MNDRRTCCAIKCACIYTFQLVFRYKNNFVDISLSLYTLIRHDSYRHGCVIRLSFWFNRTILEDRWGICRIVFRIASHINLFCRKKFFNHFFFIVSVYRSTEKANTHHHHHHHTHRTPLDCYFLILSLDFCCWQLWHFGYKLLYHWRN